MKEVFEEIKEVSIIFSQVLYMIRDALVLIILGIAGIAVSPSREHRLEMYLLIAILVFVCAGLRIAHHSYVKLVSKSRGKKRFTFLDSEGNPTIMIEDIPEIVDYLYRLEEEEQNESITK